MQWLKTFNNLRVPGEVANQVVSSNQVVSESPLIVRTYTLQVASLALPSLDVGNKHPGTAGSRPRPTGTDLDQVPGPP